MICPTCGYEFNPTSGFECPRCGEQLSCSVVSCAQCGACSGFLRRLPQMITEQLYQSDTETTADDATHD